MNPQTWVTLWEDFTRDNVTSLNETAGGSGTQDIGDGHGGWWRQANAGDDNDDLFLAGELSFQVSTAHPLVFETRVKVSNINNGANSGAGIYAGMSDAVTEASGIPSISRESGTLTTTATDAFGFLMDESASAVYDATWWGVGVQNDVDNTSVAFTNAPDAATAVWQVLRMEATADNSGTVQYFIGTANEYGGGKLVSTKTSWFRTSILYCPVLASQDRGAASNTDWDYLFVQAPRI